MKNNLAIAAGFLVAVCGEKLTSTVFNELSLHIFV